MIASRPDDISLCARLHDLFLPFHSTLSLIDSALNKVKGYMEENFQGRGLALLTQIKDHAGRIEPSDKTFPAAVRKMMKTTNGIFLLPIRERKECCTGLIDTISGGYI